jgi:TolA-binding protein
VDPLPPLDTADLALVERVLAAWPARDRNAPVTARARVVRLSWAAAVLLLITAGASAALYRALPPRQLTPPTVPPASPPVHRRSVPRASEPGLDSPPPSDAPPAPATEPTPRPPRAAPPSAAALFQRANQARGDGDVPAASALYRELQSRFPTTPEARLSFFSLGEMLLRGGDAQAALEQLRQYLRAGDDTLAEDALVQAARACQALGKPVDEASLWRRLLADFPRSDYRWRAEDRLRVLGDGAP